MKTLFSFLLGLLILPNPVLRRQVITDSFNYDFFISAKSSKKCSSNNTYTWFKNGELHTSQGGCNGALLDGVYTKSYASNNLAEKGIYKYGLKEGVWTEWYEGGKKKTISNWKRGVLAGEIKSFSETGKLVSKGKYVKGRRQGAWINFVKKDTLYYKKGEKYIPKNKLSEGEDKPNFVTRTKNYFKRIFGKIKKRTRKKTRKQEKRKVKTAVKNRKLSRGNFKKSTRSKVSKSTK